MPELVRRLLAVRIVRWPIKLAYVVGAYLLAVGFGQLTRLIPLDPLSATLDGVFSLVLVLFGARIFRIPGEAVAPSRAWWRMTGRRRLSVVLVVLLLLSLGSSLLTITVGTFLHGQWVRRPVRAIDVEVVITSVISVALYLNSAIRLKPELEPARPAKLAAPSPLS